MFLRNGLIASCLLGALVFGAAHARAGRADDTLNVGLSKPVQVLDPEQSDGYQERVLAYNMLETLLYWDSQSLEVKPGLASSWKYADDLTLDLQLRDDVTFHDGQKLTADDIVYSVSLVTGDGLAKLPSSLKTRYNFITGAEKTGTYSVRLHFGRITPLALPQIATSLWIVPHEYHARVGATEFGQHVVGTGPYRVGAFEPNHSLLLERYPGYHTAGWGKPAIAHISVAMIPELQTQIAQMIAGQIDFLWRLPSDQAQRLARVKEVVVAYGGTTGMEHLIMDAMGRSGPGPMQDVRVRQAVMHAVNRAEILKNLIGNGAQLLAADCHPRQFGCPTDVMQYDYDPAKAKQLLAEAGYPNGLDISFAGFGAENRSVLQAIQSDLAAVGIRATLDFQDTNVWIKNFTAGKLPFTFTIWSNYGILDADTAVSFMLVDPGGRYHADKDVIDWFNRAGTILDPAERLKLYHMGFARVAEQAYVLPLWTQTTNYVLSPELNFTPPQDGQPLLYTATWK